MSIRLAIFSNARMTTEMQPVWDEFRASVEIHLVEAVFKKAIVWARRLENDRMADVFV